MVGGSYTGSIVFADAQPSSSRASAKALRRGDRRRRGPRRCNFSNDAVMDSYSAETATRSRLARRSSAHRRAASFVPTCSHRRCERRRLCASGEPDAERWREESGADTSARGGSAERGDAARDGGQRGKGGTGPRRGKDRLVREEEASHQAADAHDRDAELAGLVDRVAGDARSGERDDALRQEVEQLVVAAEGRGLAVGVPVGTADHLVDASCLCPARRDLLDAGTATAQQDDVAVLRTGTDEGVAPEIEDLRRGVRIRVEMALILQRRRCAGSPDGIARAAAGNQHSGAVPDPRARCHDTVGIGQSRRLQKSGLARRDRQSADPDIARRIRVALKPPGIPGPNEE